MSPPWSHPGRTVVRVDFDTSRTTVWQERRRASGTPAEVATDAVVTPSRLVRRGRWCSTGRQVPRHHLSSITDRSSVLYGRRQAESRSSVRSGVVGILSAHVGRTLWVRVYLCPPVPRAYAHDGPRPSLSRSPATTAGDACFTPTDRGSGLGPCCWPGGVPDGRRNRRSRRSPGRARGAQPGGGRGGGPAFPRPARHPG